MGTSPPVRAAAVTDGVMPDCDCAGDVAGAQRRANVGDLVTTAIARAILRYPA